MPTVSVIIPVYNRFGFLAQAIESVLNQKFKDVELIVVDDGSAEDISPVMSKFPTARLVRQKNRGAAIARNAGVLHSTGEYLAFLDSDDYWKEDKLSQQVELMEEDADLGACYTRFDLVDSNGTFLRFTKPIEGYESYLDLVQHFGMIPSGTLVRRSIFQNLGGFDPMESGAADMDLFLKIALFSKIRFIEESLTCYRVHDSNLHSSNTLRILPTAISVLNKHVVYAQRLGDKNTIRAALAGRKRVSMVAARKLVGCARNCIYRKEFFKAIYYLWQAAITARSLRPHMERLMLLVKNMKSSSDPPDLRVLGLRSESRRS